MLRGWMILSVMMIWVTFGLCADAQETTATPITIGESFQMKSTVMSESREVNIWLPPSYAEGDRAYPVLYVIDGGLDQDFQHT